MMTTTKNSAQIRREDVEREMADARDCLAQAMYAVGRAARKARLAYALDAGRAGNTRQAADELERLHERIAREFNGGVEPVVRNHEEAYPGQREGERLRGVLQEGVEIADRLHRMHRLQPGQRYGEIFGALTRLGFQPRQPIKPATTSAQAGGR
jgi:hypothetical protein